MTPQDQAFEAAAQALGHRFDGEIVVGGAYAPLVRDGRTLHVAGQVPRVGTTVVVTGRAGDSVPLERARHAAEVCAMRALAVLQRELGSLAQVARILKVNVYVQCTADFTQHSEVADAASALLQRVLGEAGVHARTSVGVYQLPKNATVELDLVALQHEAPTPP